MTPDRHQQIKRLFLAAVELAPLEAASFLASACGGDEKLQSEVQSLLDNHSPDTLLAAELSSGETAISAAAAQLPTASRRAGAHAEAEDECLAVHPPGTIIAGRYRLVAPLGQGGMGIVYRAEDLELSQTVALKFLHPRLKDFDGAVEMLRREVRTARQISHPNVVRVFDIGTTAGEVFISMEYVAGEDLESLIRRVERLTAEKLREVARQLAAGLSAAHDNGILHRDLKPANVMLDGNGNVRILDFGISAALSERDQLRMLSGTPGFVAPELLEGQTPTPQSDLFSLGLVIYFAATGRLPPALPGDQPQADMDSLAADGIDAALATAISACLQADPAWRPRSAHELVIALSADDPLQTVVAAGRVPPAELVIAAHSWRPSVRLLDALLGSGLALIMLVAALADHTLFLSRCGLVKSPEALREIAERTLIRLGASAPQRPVLSGITLDIDGLKFVGRQAELPDLWSKIRAGQVPVVFFWHRQGDPRLPRPAPLGEPAWERLAQPLPGTATVRLDGQGRLLSLQVATSSSAAAPSKGNPVDWQPLFEQAGLQLSDFQEVEVERWPPLFADEVRAWEGPFPAQPQLPLKIIAASLQGRVVFFDVDQPWEQSRAFDAMVAWSGQTSRFVTVRTVRWLVAIALAAALAWHNVRRGYADWLGAWRAALGVMILAAIDWLLGARHTLVVAEEVTVGFLWLNVIVFSGAVAGVAYLAVEPPARRWWPWSIITTRRLLAGRCADRDIWADSLLGLVVGLAAVAVRQLAIAGSLLLAVPMSGVNDFDVGQDLLDCMGLRYKASMFISALVLAVLESLLLLALVVGLKRLTKSTLAAAVLLIVALATLAIVGRGLTSPAEWAVRALLWTIVSWLLIRYGLLAAIAALVTFYSVNNTPITLNLSAWYAPSSFFVLGVLVLSLVACWNRARPTLAAGRSPQ